MPKSTRPLRHRPLYEPAFPPVPHPSWSGEVPLADLARPLHAAEFWKRLGL